MSAPAPTAPPFDCVLVANRGEIAVRVIRTLRRLGIRAVAVRTVADGAAPRHAREADDVVEITSHLDAGAVVAAALATGAQAVHPGYGFLSESPALARACAAAGLVFVGPAPAVLSLMGDKIAAKEHVAGLGVPVLPGVAESPVGRRDTHADDVLVTRATEVGYPLLVKPSAGGGGKGMALVEGAADLPAAIAAARRLARAAFGDDTLLLERYVRAPRHVEVQVMGDVHGTVLHLGERDCSLQRRHQKVLEEAPAALLDEATRSAIHEAAVAVASSVGYVGAGTVEMLVPADEPSAFWFLEMNTRLQVEHPVTEMVTGLDLVELQLRVAAGEPLPLAQRDVVVTGHAVEARVYAERPDAGFLPDVGEVAAVREPIGPGVRVDSGIGAGSAVPPDFDPMLAKVVAHGADRAQALDRLAGALAQTTVLGVRTNVAWLQDLLAAPQVRAGTADTTFLDAGGVPAGAAPPSGTTLQAAARVWHDARPVPDVTRAGRAWGVADGWRLGDHRPARYRLRADDGVVMTAEVGAPPGGGPVAVVGRDVWLTEDGRVYRVHVLDATEVLAAARRPDGVPAPVDPQVRSPMPGTVTAVAAPSGSHVAAGDLLLTVEAMKMEHPVRAPAAGILDLAVAVGDVVKADHVLAVVHPGDPRHGDTVDDASPRVPPGPPGV